MKYLGRIALAALALTLAAPALADVKAGVDAWARGEYKKAVEQWRGPAAAGDPDAQFNLGQAYKLGRGVPVDLAMAEEWYRKAALQGHPQGEDNYGLALFQNEKRDQALPWLEKSAGRGEPRAQFVLGTMYFNGDSVTRDWVRAYALMTRASSAGLPQATSTLAQMDRYIGLNERQQGTQLARRYAEESQRPQLPVELAGTEQRSRRPMTTADLPPSAAERPAPEIIKAPTPRRPRPTPPPVVERPVRVAAGGGTGWRVQLGAFRDAGNARGLFATLQRQGAFAGKQPYLVKVGSITRLQVGPFGSSAEASRACAAVRGNPCVPVKG